MFLVSYKYSTYQIPNFKCNGWVRNKKYDKMKALIKVVVTVVCDEVGRLNIA